MKHKFVQTSNYKRFRAGITAVEARGAAEASMMLLVSQPGNSKSCTLEHWAVDTGAAFLRAKVEWTPHYFMTELADYLRVDTKGKAREVFQRVTQKIGESGKPLIIDEVNHCMGRGAAVLEAIRDVTDLTEVVCVLAGHDDVQPRIARYPQIRSRIAQVVEFQPASVEDIALTCRDLAEVKIADDLVRVIHAQSGGRMRDVMNAIANVERIAKRHGLGEIAAKDIGDTRVVFEWAIKRNLRTPA
jgi:hypothetical protein